MASLVFTGTHAGAELSYVANVSDLEVFQAGNRTYLYAATGSNGGATVFSISDAGAFSLSAQLSYPLSVMASPYAQIELIEVSGATYLLPFGRYDWTLNAITLDGPDLFGATESFEWGLGGLGNLSALTSRSFGDQTHVYASNAQSTGFNHYVVSEQNILELIDGNSIPTATNTSDMVALGIVSSGGAQILLGLSQQQVGISSYRLDNAGSPTFADSLSAAEYLPISAPTALVSGNVLDKTFAILASAGSSSLTVVEVGADGSLNAIDHIIDSTATRFQSITELASAQVGDRLYIVGGGADDGLSLFTLLPSGMLVHLDTVWDTNQTALQNISALSMEYVGGKLQIFATSETERGITQFEYDLAGAGETIAGDGSSSALFGSAGNDQIDGGIWSETISGGAGNDLLRDGIGEDTLVGGTGADIFVLASDDMVDKIMDFQPGVDRLNLTEFEMLYDVRQLNVEPRAWGAEIVYRNEVTYVYSADGRSLDISHFTTADTLLLNRPPNGFQYIPEIINGTNANDVLGGDEGTETLYGFGGDDVFNWSLDPDVFYGGDGTDTVNYATAASSIWVDLANRQATGAADGDVHHSIENIVGTAFDDTLIGDGSANRLVGGNGDDYLDGGLSGDTLDGGDGRDTVTYAWAREAVIARLDNGLLAGAALGDILINIENVVGTAFDDTLAGNNAENLLWGGEGNDILTGGGGDDSLAGGGGNDTLSGGSGADLLDGGSGQDWVDYRDANSQVQVDLGTRTTGWGAAGDTLVSIEHIYGSNFDDQISGADGGNTILGMDGADFLSGGSGNDELFGNSGDDSLLGQNDNDRLYGGSGNDVLSGGHGNDVLFGQWGDDIMNGGSGADILHGSYGADLMKDFGGRDKYHGGPGYDTVDYSALTNNVRVDLRSGKGFWAATGDIYTSVEGVIGSRGSDVIYGNAAHNTLSGRGQGDRIYGLGGHDTLSGDDGADQLFGGVGRDRLFGGNGPDILKGEGGNDLLQGGTGPDQLFGGPGIDIANYADAITGITVNLSTNVNKGAAAGDKLYSIEIVVGSGSDDRLIGNGQANTFRGGDGDDRFQALGGNDRLFGEDGNDTFIAGSGRDYIHGGAGTDTLVMTALGSGAHVWLTLNKGGRSMQGNTILSVENLTGTHFGDVLHGDSNDNLFRGARGNDRLTGGDGDDRLYGDLGNDHLLGNTGDDMLYGGPGDDILNGGQGDDVMVGGSGGDTFVFTSGNDSISDFDVGSDIIRINLQGAAAAAVTSTTVSDFADIRDDGIFLDFGGEASLFIENLQDLSSLQDAVVWF